MNGIAYHAANRRWKNTMEFDVIVIGSGAVASSIAYELSARGQSVCRVGPRLRGNAASVAAGAMNGCFGEVTRGLLASPYGRLKLEMDREAQRRWPGWAQRLSVASSDESTLFTAHGTHVLLNSAGMAELDSINYCAIQSALRECEEPFHDIDPRDVAWINPNDLVRPLQAMFLPNEHALNPRVLLEKLDAALISQGGVIIDEMARHVLRTGDVSAGVELLDGTSLHARHTVIAAGVHSLALLSEFDEIRRKIPPVFSGYGVSILVKLRDGHTLPTSVIRTPNRAFACGLHCVPRGEGVLYLGATNILSEAPKTTALISDVHFLLDCAVNQLSLDLQDADILSIQVGNRPIPADGFPLLGHCGIDGLWMATGTYRDGLHQSPLLACYLADQIMGVRGEDLDLRVFTPVRPPLSALSREKTVEETVKQMFATGYEYQWNIKPYWLPLLNEGLTRNYEELIQTLHPVFYPPPELVAFSYLYKSMRETLGGYYKEWT